MRSEEFITETPSPLGNKHKAKVVLSKQEKAVRKVEQLQDDIDLTVDQNSNQINK